MNRRERLMATLRGEPVDRPAVSFYQIGGHLVNRNDPDPFNIYNHPTWHPLLQLAEEKTDLIMMYPPQVCRPAVAHDAEFWHTEKYLQAGSKFTRTTLSIAGRTMTSLTRRDPDVETIWTLEHLLKDEDDLRAYLALPEAPTQMPVDIAPLLAAERELGDRGIIMVDTVDPLCLAAELFSLADYTVLAFTQRALFHKLLEKLAQPLYAQTGVLAQKSPGHLWRICGSEYATEPYLADLRGFIVTAGFAMCYRSSNRWEPAQSTQLNHRLKAILHSLKFGVIMVVILYSSVTLKVLTLKT